MSYDRNVLVGWFAEFSGNTEKRKSGTKKIKFCPTSKKHETRGKYCPICGEEIQTKEEDEFESFDTPYGIYHAEEKEDLDASTFGKGSMKDLKEIKKSYMICSEFLPTIKTVLFAPGFVELSDVGREDGLIEEVDFNNKPTDEWIETIKRLFCVSDVNLKFGAVMEVV